ncbi:MAG: hypothetical protein RB191_11400 [Terriglobia bacterium]|nr:hypothetical protein [Terriglobia bacterium]
MNITEKAMLAQVHISVWTARKHDRKASREVAETNGASEDAGRYHKRLLCKGSKLDEILSLSGRIRQAFYEITLPWSDDGPRILPGNLYFDFNAKMRDFEREFHTAVESFLISYSDYVQQVRPVLGALFRAEDYPDVSKLREKFEIKVDILPIPSGSDFRVNLSDAETARIAHEIDETTRKSTERGIRDLWMRLFEVVRHMASRLEDPDARLHGTVVTNVSELVELLPHLNLTGDPALTALTEQTREQLCRYSADHLRASAASRAETAANATRLAQTIAGVLDITQEPIPAKPVETAKPEEPSLFSPVAAAAVEQKADAIFSHMAAFMGGGPA